MGKIKMNTEKILPKNIWGEGKAENYFRKLFSLSGKPAKAILRIFVDTGYELFLNGRFVASVDEWGNTRDYDVASFLRAGRNIIAVRAMNHSGHRGFCLELRTVSQQGKIFSVISDASWLTLPEERWGWRCADYDASEWKKPRILFLGQVGAEQWKNRPGDNPSKVIPFLECTPFLEGGCPKCVDSPFFETKTNPVKTPGEIFDVIGLEYQDNLDEFPLETVFPVKVVESDSGNGSLKNVAGLLEKNGSGMKVTASHSAGGPFVIVDFGGEIAGYLRLRTVCESSVRIKLHFGETLTECFNYPPPDALLNRMIIEEVAVSSGRQEWESRMRQGFRFVRIEFMNCRHPLEIQGVSAKTSLYPVTYKGYFSCSDPVLNKIWEAGRRTLHLCMQEYYLDGIKRDRFLWSGDARLEALINYYAFGDGELFRYCWRKLAETQYRDGGIPAALGEGASIIWDYVAWWIIALDDYHMHTGDVKFLESMKVHIVKAVGWLLSKSGPDGLIDVPENKTEGWMCVLNKKTGKDFMMNFLFGRSLLGVSRIMGVLGDVACSSKYAKLAQKTEKSLCKLHGNVSIDDFKESFEHDASASLGGFEIIETYFKNRRPEEGLRFIRENWGPMLAAGSDTLWEYPVKNPAGRIDEKQDLTKFVSTSRCHGWTAGPTYALLSEVVGIKPTLPGFAAFEVKPQMGELASVNGVVPTPLGLIAVSIKRNAGSIDETIIIPKGCRGRIGLPKLTNEPAVYLNGKRIEGKGRSPVRITAEEDYLFLELRKPGKYVFHVEFN